MGGRVVSGQRKLTLDEALDALSPGFPEVDVDDDWNETPTGRMRVHTYLSFLGCDWDRAEAEKAIRDNAEKLYVVDPDTFAWKIDHRVFIAGYGKSGSALFFETKPGALETGTVAS